MNKNEALKDSLWQVTIYAAFQRAKIYSSDATNTDRKGLKKLLREEINKKLEEYKEDVSDSAHFSNISSIAKAIEKHYSIALIGGSISIGVIQKAFNLYLKLMWCLNEIPEPPQCPLDKVIIDKLDYKYRKSWTKIKNIEEYVDLITELSNLTGNKSLAVWELEIYEKP